MRDLLSQNWFQEKINWARIGGQLGHNLFQEKAKKWLV
jgi:hypothetical protein